jgi:hypothetical protein
MGREYDFSQGTRGKHAGKQLHVVGDSRSRREPHPDLIRILAPAYQPCPAFKTACTSMRFSPENGYVPRGFCGATGSLDEVDLVLVVAEPGDPQEGEVHTSLFSAYEYATVFFSTAQDLYSRNVRRILGMCWPDLSFDEQMRKVWITDSVLCSAKSECASVPATVELECASRYLRDQLKLFPDALVVAFGKKAQRRLVKIGFTNFLPAWSPAPPGCNQAQARDSWQQIPQELAKRRQRSV